MKFFLYIIIILFPVFLKAQIIPANRIVNWKYAGLTVNDSSYQNVLDITNYGGNGNGITLNDAAFTNCKNALNGMPGVIYFPAGTYLFHASLSISDSTIIRGASSALSLLQFDFSGAISDCINAIGVIQSQRYYFTSDGMFDSTALSVSSNAGLHDGDYVRIFQNDTSLVISSWAYGTVGQIGRIKTVGNATSVTLEHELRKNYNVSDSAYLRVMTPVTGVGIECLTVERLDATISQTSNIIFTNAVNCWIKGVESNMANFAHVTLRSSSNIYIHECYFHHAFAYGGNGQGYGIDCETTSGECLIENNIFNNLRHSMLCQAGVNGNVFAYNYSVNPYWTQPPFPTNTAGDIVLHGNYAFANLFEGNIIQNIVIDNSHDINGPYNTFFRNRAELYGLYMNTGPASNDQNFVGNEIPNTTVLMGNYTLAGTGHFQYGNNVKGTITPSGTTSLTDTSYYLTQKPMFFGANAWPCIGMPSPFNQLSIPAKDRFNIQNTLCSIISVVNEIPKQESSFKIFLKNHNSLLQVVNSNNQRNFFTVYDMQGRQILSHEIVDIAEINISKLKDGMYIISNKSNSLKFIKY